MPAIKFIPNQNFPLGIPVNAPVNGAGTGINETDTMDKAAVRKGFTQIYSHGWIATMGDKYHNPEHMLGELNQKVQIAKEHDVPFLAGFVQTGNFSVAWTIYTKPPYGQPV